MGENDKAKLREALQAALANPENQAVLRELARTDVADMEAIASDWHAVGGNMRRAIERLSDADARKLVAASAASHDGDVPVTIAGRPSTVRNVEIERRAVQRRQPAVTKHSALCLAAALLAVAFCVAVLYGNLWAINRLVAANMPMLVAQLELISNAIAKIQEWAGGVL